MLENPQLGEKLWCVNYCLSLGALSHKHFPAAFKNVKTPITSSLGMGKIPCSAGPSTGCSPLSTWDRENKMLTAKLCATMRCSCNPSLWFSYGSEETFCPQLLPTHSPCPGGAENAHSHTPTRDLGQQSRKSPAGTGRGAGAPLMSTRARPCLPGAPSAPWPFFNLCLKAYLLFQRKQPAGCTSYDKGCKMDFGGRQSLRAWQGGRAEPS